MAFTTQFWAIRLFLALLNEGGRSHQSKGQHNWQESWGSAGWLITPERDRSCIHAELSLYRAPVGARPDSVGLCYLATLSALWHQHPV